MGTPRSKRWLLIISLFFMGSLVGVMLARHAGQLGSSNSADKTADDTSPAFDTKQFSLDNPASPWIIVNKHRPLNPKTYVPQLVTPNVSLRLKAGSGEMEVAAQTASALEQLFAAAEAANLSLMLASGYRSYDMQTVIYNKEVKSNGQVAADRESARPGYSEHQTGLAADIEPTSRQCEVEQCFGDLPEGKWLAANAATYGFVLRYPQNKESTTGYLYEPWHIRYVGTDLAKELQNHPNDAAGTLETYFKLEAAPSYL